MGLTLIGRSTLLQTLVYRSSQTRGNDGCWMRLMLGEACLSLRQLEYKPPCRMTNRIEGFRKRRKKHFVVLHRKRGKGSDRVAWNCAGFREVFWQGGHSYPVALYIVCSCVRVINRQGSRTTTTQNQAADRIWSTQCKKNYS